MDPFDSQQGKELQRVLVSWFADQHGVSLADALVRLDQLQDDYTWLQGRPEELRNRVTVHVFVCQRCTRPVMRIMDLTEYAFVAWETGSSSPPTVCDNGDNSAEFVQAAQWFRRHRHRPDSPTVVPVSWFKGVDGKFPIELTCDCRTGYLDARIVMSSIDAPGDQTMVLLRQWRERTT